MSTLFLLALFYMLPTLIALFRSHKDLAVIGLLNIFLGWTIVMWIFSLILAFTNPANKETTVIINNVNKD